MNEPAILLFDGVCNLCNDAVQYILERDPQAHFRFAPLQSDAGREILRRCRFPPDSLDSIVLVEGDSCTTCSDAALRIASHLGGAWPLFGILRILPRALRDRGYGYLANHRYQWFGKRDRCMVPTPELRSRFLT